VSHRQLRNLRLMHHQSTIAHKYAETAPDFLPPVKQCRTSSSHSITPSNFRLQRFFFPPPLPLAKVLLRQSGVEIFYDLAISLEVIWYESVTPGDWQPHEFDEIRFATAVDSHVEHHLNLALFVFLYGTRVWWDGVTSNQKPMINRFDRGRWFEDLV
jgi:hypothetical protein